MHRAVALVLVVLVAGCSTPAPAPTVSTPQVPADPSGATCDAARPAVAHHADARPAAAELAPPLPCLSRTGFLSVEPSIGIASSGHVFFFPATGEGGRGIVRSVDLGVSWELLVPSASGVATHPDSFDPMAYLDPATDRIFVDDLTGPAKCSVLSFSDDEGETWTNTAAGCTQFDHATVFAGPPVTSATMGYPNIVYHCAYMGGGTSVAGTSSSCERSLDGGMTWLPTGAPAVGPAIGEGNNGAPYCNAALGHGAVGPDGAIYLPNALCGDAMLAMSRDEGVSWRNVRVSDLRVPISLSGDHGHETGVGVDPEGNLYYAWVARDRLPHLTLSRDGGETWSPPIMIAAPGVKEAGLAEIVVGGVGKLAVVYMGSTNSPGGPFPEPACPADPLACVGQVDEPDYGDVTWNGYLAMTVDALAPDPVFFTAAVNDPADPLIRGACGPGGCAEVADFIDVRIGPDGVPWAALIDACTEDCATGERMVDEEDGEGIVARLVGGPSLL